MKSKFVWLLGLLSATVALNAQLKPIGPKATPAATPTITPAIISTGTPGAATASTSTLSTHKAPTSNNTLGQLIAQFTENISSSALTPGFLQNEKGWIIKANRANNLTALIFFVQSLHDGLKPAAYRPKWETVRAKWVADSNKIASVKDAAGLISTLSDNIAPAYLTSGWPKSEPAFKAALSGVTQ